MSPAKVAAALIAAAGGDPGVLDLAMPDGRTIGAWLDSAGVQVLSARETAHLFGVNHTTVRRWVREGALRDVFADMPTGRVGVARCEVDQIVTGAGVVAAPEAGAAGSLTVLGRNHGGPTNRTTGGSHPPAA